MTLPYTLFLSLSLLLLSGASNSAALANDAGECVYTIFVRTGSIIKAGTDSNISVKLYNAHCEHIDIANLEAWGGMMGPKYNYFERGNLDIFSGRGPCFSSPMCGLGLFSDGSGPNHGWYCNYVEVSVSGIDTPCTQERFTVEQWLDTSPYKLTAVRNYCKKPGFKVKGDPIEISGSAAMSCPM